MWTLSECIDALTAAYLIRINHEIWADINKTYK